MTNIKMYLLINFQKNTLNAYKKHFELYSIFYMKFQRLLKLFRLQF